MLLFLFKALNGISNINIDPYVDFYSDADHYSFRKYFFIEPNDVFEVHVI